MKKATRKPTKTSKTPPKGWPSEEIITEAERKMKGGLASKLISPDAGPVERAKHELCELFIRYRRDEEITQRELAKRLEVTENRVSEILHYHHEQFTIDRLLELLHRVKPGITVKVA
ncbi:MAG: helix-turn-helix domain-containing protein [Bdellovibrionales bacterium]|nr:helix-turn-helix domain-containing protein [Bdellovibrionales bacterium]